MSRVLRRNGTIAVVSGDSDRDLEELDLWVMTSIVSALNE
jgi:hypothetical protein